jgi:hypothetical protein
MTVACEGGARAQTGETDASRMLHSNQVASAAHVASVLRVRPMQRAGVSARLHAATGERLEEGRLTSSGGGKLRIVTVRISGGR